MVVWLRAYPSSVEVDCVCIASVALYWLREEFGTPSGLEILLGEGGDVELGARTSEHIIVFAFDLLPLNSLFFILCCASFIHIIYCLCFLASFILPISIVCLVCLCVPHLYLTTRASYSTSTLI